MADTWIHARVDEDVRAELDRVAKDEDRTRSQMIRALIGEALAARHKKEQS